LYSSKFTEYPLQKHKENILFLFTKTDFIGKIENL
jgi:hypothetical protein